MSTPKSSRARRPVPGTVARVPVGDGSFVYAVVLRTAIRFFATKRRDELADLAALEHEPVLFELMAYDTAIVDGRWPTVGRIVVDPDYVPAFFIQDAGGCRILEEPHMRPASLEACVGLENAVLWEPDGVEERLAAHFAGRDDPRTRSHRLRMPGEPPWPQ